MKMFYDKKFLLLITVIMLVCTTVFSVTAYYNIQEINKLQKEFKNISTTATNESRSKSEDPEVNKLKREITKLEGEISDIEKHDLEKSTLKNLIEKVCDTLTFDYNVDKSEDVITQLKKYFTDDCYNNFIQYVTLDETFRYSSEYTPGSIWYSDVDTDSPKAICKARFVDTVSSETCYMDFEFTYDDSVQTYYVSKLTISN